MNPFELDEREPMDDYNAWLKYYENFFTTYNSIFDNDSTVLGIRQYTNVYGYMIVNDDVKN